MNTSSVFLRFAAHHMAQMAGLAAVAGVAFQAAGCGSSVVTRADQAEDASSTSVSTPGDVSVVTTSTATGDISVVATSTATGDISVVATSTATGDISVVATSTASGENPPGMHGLAARERHDGLRRCFRGCRRGRQRDGGHLQRRYQRGRGHGRRRRLWLSLGRRRAALVASRRPQPVPPTVWAARPLS